jgi:hypothetical protein
MVSHRPTPVFTPTIPDLAQVVFDGSSRHDVKDPIPQLQAYWDWEGDGLFDSSAVSVTKL